LSEGFPMLSPQEEYTSLLKMKPELIYRVQLLTLFLINCAGALSISFSVFDAARKLNMIFVYNGLLSSMMVILFLMKRFIVNSKIQNRAYIVFTLIIIVLIQFLSMEYSIVISMTFLSSMVMLVYIHFNKRFVYIATLLYLGIVLYHLISMPVITVRLSYSYYISSFFVIIIAFSVSHMGITLFKKYEDLLFRKIKTTTEQMDEIKSLNLKTNKALQILESIFEASHDGIVDIEQSHGTVNMSSRSCEILAFQCSGLDTLELELSTHLEAGKKSEFFHRWEELKSRGGKSYSRECYYHHPDERKRLKFNILAYTSSEDESRHILLVVKDITNEDDQAEKIYKSAYEDSLTGLMNRQALVEYIEKHREKYFISCVAILDIDNFRFINDSFGYEIGDRLLQEIGKRMVGHEIPFVKAAARLSSNDFALYLDTVVDEDQLYARIQNDYSQYILDDIEIKLNFSVGIAYFSDSEANADGLIKKAEIAMYKAKERGKKGVCVFSDDLNNEMIRHLDIMNELEDAISHHEFYLNYQPKIDTRTDRIIGFEALIRWQSPRLGFVPPDEFIQLAEQSGLIHLIGEFVIRESCQFLKRIMADYGFIEDFRISVNVSAVQLLNSSFYSSFFSILDEAAVPPEMIGLEVTETAVMENKAYVCNQLEKFRAKGVRIYLDDFGTGYSSLNYLTMLPIDILKIDKSFVDNITNKNREYQVVKLILSLASVFSLTTIAEGVETKDQLDILQSLDCHIVQGYYFSKPLIEVDGYKMVLERNPL
jgi:diguanylate cyclase (GGDEF)-like protein